MSVNTEFTSGCAARRASGL